MTLDQELSSRRAFDVARTAVFNLSAGKLLLSGFPNQTRDTDFTYIVEVSRVDGRRLTKQQIEWTAATVAAVEYCER